MGFKQSDDVRPVPDSGVSGEIVAGARTLQARIEELGWENERLRQRIEELEGATGKVDPESED